MRNFRNTFRQFALFFGVGAVATSVHYLLLVVLASGLSVDPVAAAAAGYVAGAATSYVLNYRVTFKSTLGHKETLVKFFAIAGAGLALNTWIVSAGVSVLHLHYLLAQVFATALVLGWNFALNKMWTFREE
jgi:putative flippase GtrA